MAATFDVPRDRFYDRENHFWVLPRAESGGVTVGMDALGLASLGHLAYVKLDAVGTSVTRGDAVGTLEAEKMTSQVVAPVSGTITAINEEALQDPLLVNRDPHGAGWLYVIEPSSWERDSEELITGDAVEPWVESEAARYREEGWIE